MYVVFTVLFPEAFKEWYRIIAFYHAYGYRNTVKLVRALRNQRIGSLYVRLRL